MESDIVAQIRKELRNPTGMSSYSLLNEVLEIIQQKDAQIAYLEEVNVSAREQLTDQVN